MHHLPGDIRSEGGLLVPSSCGESQALQNPENRSERNQQADRLGLDKFFGDMCPDQRNVDLDDYQNQTQLGLDTRPHFDMDCMAGTSHVDLFCLVSGFHLPRANLDLLARRRKIPGEAEAGEVLRSIETRENDTHREMVLHLEMDTRRNLDQNDHVGPMAHMGRGVQVVSHIEDNRHHCLVEQARPHFRSRMVEEHKLVTHTKEVVALETGSEHELGENQQVHPGNGVDPDLRLGPSRESIRHLRLGPTPERGRFLELASEP